ncbi:hypothetical protein C8039_17745 [Halogeometricum sp. wsp3]|nr:hypothetical protein C8039_17745 [Halogeometricum sp. wsp3]
MGLVVRLDELPTLLVFAARATPRALGRLRSPLGDPQRAALTTPDGTNDNSTTPDGTESTNVRCRRTKASVRRTCIASEEVPQ